MGKIMLPTEDNYLLSVSFFQSDLEDAADENIGKGGIVHAQYHGAGE